MVDAKPEVDLTFETRFQWLPRQFPGQASPDHKAIQYPFRCAYINRKFNMLDALPGMASNI